MRGPMTREQIKRLMAHKKADPASAATLAQAAKPAKPLHSATAPPVMPPGLEVSYLRASGAGQGLEYYPAVVGKLEVHYTGARLESDAALNLAFAAEVEEGPIPVDWDNAIEIDLDPSDIETDPLPGATFAELPGVAQKPNEYAKWRKDLLSWVRQNRPLVLYRSKRFKMTSRPGESEGEFRSKLSQAAREKRDLAVEKIRKKYDGKFTTLRNRLMRAEQAISREQEQAKSKKIETMISFGTAILGAFLGRKAVSATSATRMGTAMKSAGRMQKEKMDVARARETADAVRQQMAELDARLQADIDRLEAAFDPSSETLEEVHVKPKRTDMALQIFGLTWLPYRTDIEGRLNPDWR
jgi:hypothetical protein